MKFNLNHRIILFSICSSLEYDIKQKIKHGGNKLNIPKDLIKKAKEREKKSVEFPKLLDALDLGDYIEILKSNPYVIGLNQEQVKTVSHYFEKIIPIRNRVMHTRPLELGDRSTLYEVLEGISSEIKCIDWTETTRLEKQLKSDPTKILEEGTFKKRHYLDSVFHNLPSPEFDDTGYIGRRKETKHLNELIMDDKNQIISIIGNGGMGKTALAVKVLYDIIDSPDNPYEAVLYISLKTRTLSLGEFVNIEDAIIDISKVYKQLEKATIVDDDSPKNNILEFLATFKTLLVLDNLETINTIELIRFLKDIPSKSKVLITSRHGIGELENRFNLSGLDTQDAKYYFRELSQYYGLDIHKRSDKEIIDIVKNNLYLNPLSIKWFITSIYTGVDETSLLNNKSELVEFCMSNVYNKLSETAKHIIQLFLVEKVELSVGEIDFFLSIESVNLRGAINEMLSTNMVKLNKGKYLLDEMAKDYLSKFFPPSNEFFLKVIKKRKELNSLIQTINALRINDPYNPKSLTGAVEDTDKKIATYYLQEALSKKNLNKKRKLLEKAQSIAPDYFEVYKIWAFIEGQHKNIYQAVENYQISVSMAEEPEDKARILFLYAQFYVLVVEDYMLAEEIILKAEELFPNNMEILFEKNRILIRLGKFEEAFENIKLIKKINKKATRDRNSMIVKSIAEVYRRKAETINIRDYSEEKVNLLSLAIKEIETLSIIDRSNAFTLLNVMVDLSYLYHSNNAMRILKETMIKHFDSISWIKNKSFLKIKNNIEKNRDIISKDVYKELIKYLTNFKVVSETIDSPNEGLVIALKKRGFGFIANSSRDNIFFHLNNVKSGKITIGDRVEFDLYENKKGIAAKNIVVKE